MIRTDSLRRTRDRARRSSRQRQRMSRWLIQRPGEGQGSHDGDGNWTPPTPTTIYEGDAFLESETTSTVRVRARADGALVTADPVLVVPHDAGPFKVGDVCTPLDAPGSLMERTWRVSGPSGDSYAVDQGLRVQEVTDA